jgi:hypothetical protein
VDLADAVATYLRIAGEFNRPVHLSRFGLIRTEIEIVFSASDEDYQISRYMLLSRAPDEELASLPPELRLSLVKGHDHTHVIFHGDIRRFLAAV